MGAARLRVTALIGLTVWGASGLLAAEEALRLRTTETVVERKSFDPRQPPVGLPPLAADERAVTVAEFRIAVAVEVLGGRPRRTEEGFRARVTVTAIEIEPRLAVTLWLPTDADAQLTAHEEGHRMIAERLYAEGAEFIRELAGGYLGRELSGEGESADAARDAATRPVVEELSAAWLARTHGVTEEVASTYDRLTDHGRDRAVAVEAAIEQGLAAWRAERPGAGD